MEDLKVFHKECRGKIEVKEIFEKKRFPNNVLKDGTLFSSHDYLESTCTKCKKRLWSETWGDEAYDPLSIIKRTAIDGKNRYFQDFTWQGKVNPGLSSKFLSEFLVKKENDMRGAHAIVVQRGKVEKAIGELKEKLAKVEQAKKMAGEKAKKTIKELKEKLAKFEQAKREPEEIYCPYCGTQLVSTELFCSSCGTDLKKRISELKEVVTEK